jgi:hypothetical protein
MEGGLPCVQAEQEGAGNLVGDMAPRHAFILYPEDRETANLGGKWLKRKSLERLIWNSVQKELEIMAWNILL